MTAHRNRPFLCPGREVMAGAAVAAGAVLLAACGTRVAHGAAGTPAAASDQGPPPIPAATLRLVARGKWRPSGRWPRAGGRG
jgi:hypothetical protein